jgi:hypothetical protein
MGGTVRFLLLLCERLPQIKLQIGVPRHSVIDICESSKQEKWRSYNFPYDISQVSTLSQELRPSVESGKALARTSRANKNIQIMCLRFSSEGLRNLGKN